MNWIKLSNDQKPEFDKPVLLFEKISDKNFVNLGKLDSIGKDGLRWKSLSISDFNDIFGNMFGGNLSLVSSFNPTHYCEIDSLLED